MTRAECQVQPVWIRTRTASVVAILLVAVATFLGCSRSEDALRWTEDATLADGRIVTLHREQWFDGGTAEDGSGLRGRMTIRFAHPDTAQPVVWDSPYGFTTQALLIDRGRVATFYHCDSWYELGRPKLPYTEYRYRGKQWIQEPLSPQWIGAPANLFTGMGPNSSKDLTVAEKARRLNDTTVGPSFRSITTKWQHGC